MLVITDDIILGVTVNHQVINKQVEIVIGPLDMDNLIFLTGCPVDNKGFSLASWIG